MGSGDERPELSRRYASGKGVKSGAVRLKLGTGERRESGELCPLSVASFVKSERDEVRLMIEEAYIEGVRKTPDNERCLGLCMDWRLAAAEFVKVKDALAVADLSRDGLHERDGAGECTLLGRVEMESVDSLRRR